MYFGNNKDRFQLQFPDAVCQRLGAMPKEFTLKSQRKGVKRFWTPFITEKFTLLQRVGICRGVLIVVGGAETGFVEDCDSGRVSQLLSCNNWENDPFVAPSELVTFGTMCRSIGCTTITSSHINCWRWSW